MKLLGFTETSTFTKNVMQLLSDDEYALLQMHLIELPDDGSLIPEGKGIRKVRWRAKGRGKRGGVRVIYYWAVRRDKILMLDIYAKNEKTDLDKDELKELVEVVESWRQENEQKEF